LIVGLVAAANGAELARYLFVGRSPC